MYENMTPELLLEQLLENVSDAVDKREGSVAHDLLYPAAIEISNAYVELDAMVESSFLDTAEAEYLDRWADTFGVDRKPAAKAVGSVTLTGPEGTTVPAGTRLQTSQNVFFITLADARLAGGTATVAAEAEEGGAKGNAGLGMVNALAPGEFYGIVNVTNAAAFTGGVEIEDDDALRERIYTRVRKPATSGNANHYLQWALETPGIVDAKVTPIWNGPGTVKVVLYGEGRRAPATPILNAAKAHIEASRPIGAAVTVIGAAEMAVNITATLQIKADASLGDIKAAFIEKFEEYIGNMSQSETQVRMSKVAALLIAVPGVVDYTSLKLNGTAANVAIPADTTAVPGTVTLS